MSLSEDERRTLREMESALLREDPRFAAAMSAGPGHRRITTAVAVGFGVVVVVIVLIVCFGPRVVGVAGLLIMVVIVAILLPRRMIGGSAGSGRPGHNGRGRDVPNDRGRAPRADRRPERWSPTWAEALAGVDPALRTHHHHPGGLAVGPDGVAAGASAAADGRAETRPLGHLHPDTPRSLHPGEVGRGRLSTADPPPDGPHPPDTTP